MDKHSKIALSGKRPNEFIRLLLSVKTDNSWNSKTDLNYPL
jgi:hypothetical protein